MIIHEGTIVQATFARIDDQGNVIERKPMQTQISVFSQAEFEQAFEMLKKAWDDWRRECQASSE